MFTGLLLLFYKIEETFHNMSILSSIFKIFSIIIGILAPLKTIFHVMFFFLIINFITGVYKNCIVHKQRLEPKKIKHTVEKFASYIIILIMIWLFEVHIVNLKEMYIVRTIVALMLMAEFKSVTDNLDDIVGTKIFTTIYKHLNKLFKNKLNSDESK